jgi:hypothetical protein
MNEPLDYPIGPKNYQIENVENVNYDNMICVVFKEDVFTANMTTFGQFKSDEKGKNFRLILQLFSKINSQTSLGYSENVEEKISEEERETNNKKKNLPYIIDKIHNKSIPRLRRFMERIVDKDNKDITLGWRLYIFSNDDNFSFCTALQKLIKENQNEKSKFLETNPKFINTNTFNIVKDRYKILTDNIIYINNVVSTYLNCSTSSSSIQNSINNIYAKDTISEFDPIASPLNVFSLNRAFEEYEFPSCLNIQNDIDYYKTDSDVFSFPSPENVWEFDHFVFVPRIFDRLRIFNLTMRNNPNINDEQHRKMTSRILMARINSNINDNHQVLDNDIKYTSLRNHKEILRIQSLNLSPEEEEEEMRSFYKFARSDFISMWADDANLSPPINAMLQWYNNGITSVKCDSVNFSPFMGLKPLDRSLSPFANMITGILTKLEVVSKVSTAHWHFLLCWIASLDTYRHSYDLKLNVLLAGPGASSKSFLLTLLEKLSMQGTIQAITHQTKRAMNTDVPIVNAVHTYDECPPHMIGQDKKDAGETGDTTTKSAMTSGKITTTSFQLDEITGRRSARTTEIDCLRTVIANTNEDISLIPEALFSRFLVVALTSSNHEDRSLLDVIHMIESKMSTKFGKQFNTEMSFYRYILTIIFKKIQCKVLPEVNVNIASTVINKLLANLKKQGYKLVNPRLVKRMLIVARILTILNSIYIVFISEKAIRPKGTEFDISMVDKVAPYLVCSEEIAIFSFTFFSDSIINSMEREIMMALMLLINRQNNKNDDDKGRFVSSQSTTGEDIIDYDYYLLKYSSNRAISFQPASHAIKSVITEKRVSPENINTVMKELRERTISCKSYDSSDILSNMLIDEDNDESSSNNKRKCNDSGEFNMKDLARILSKSESPKIGKMQQKPILQIDSANGGIRVLRNYVELCAKQLYMENDSEYKSPIFKAIDSLQHKFTRERRILSATTCPGYRDSAPHVFRVITLKPNDTIMQIPNTNVLTKTEQLLMGVENVTPDISQAVLIVDEDIEDLEIYRHHDFYSSFMDIINYKQFTPSSYEKYNNGNSIKYPDDYLKELDEKYQKIRNIKMGKFELMNTVKLSELVRKNI